MSQNLVGVIKKFRDKYYLFPEVAEATVGDTQEYIGPPGQQYIHEDNYYRNLPEGEWKRELEITQAMGPFSTWNEAVKAGNEEYEYFEYGYQDLSMIDGVKLILTLDGVPVKSDTEERKTSFLTYLLEDVNNIKDPDERDYIASLVNDAADKANVDWDWVYDIEKGKYEESGYGKE